MTHAKQPEALDERMKFEAAMIALAAEISGNDGAPLIFARDRNGYTNGAMEIGWRLFQAGRASIKAEGTEQKRPRQCLHGISEPSAWVSVKDRLPEPGMAVLLDIGKKTPIRAMWAAKHTVEAHDEADPGWCDYDETTGMYYCPEGWYEWNQHEEVHWAVSEKPRAWMPLPSPSSADEGGSNG